jgi:hypothetical protein
VEIAIHGAEDMVGKSYEKGDRYLINKWLAAGGFCASVQGDSSKTLILGLNKTLY